MNDRSWGRSVVVAVGPVDRATAALFAGGAHVVEGFQLPDEPWMVEGVVCVGCVTSSDDLADAVGAGLRGADLLLEVAPHLERPLWENCTRAGFRPWAPSEPIVDNDWMALLEEMSSGSSVAEAARSCHMSTRTAFRHLGRARRALGASNTAMAIGMWSERSADRIIDFVSPLKNR